jgi:hypothetical protein
MTSTKSRRRTNEYAYRDKLPFIGKGHFFGWWSVKPSGDYQRDFATGREYALQFWKVCGKHGNMGLDLSSILLAVCEVTRGRRRTGVRRSGVSGIEVGFLRTIGDLFQASMFATVMVGIGSKRLAKRDLSRREGQQKSAAAAGLVGILAHDFHRGTVQPEAVQS